MSRVSWETQSRDQSEGDQGQNHGDQAGALWRLFHTRVATNNMPESGSDPGVLILGLIGEWMQVCSINGR